MFTSRTLGILSAALLLLSSGCGSDSSSDDGAQPVPQSSEGQSETFDDDVSVAEAAVLTLDDLPAGWSSEPRQEDGDDGEFDQELADCAGVPVEEVTESGNPKAESETFVAEDNTEIEAEVVVAPTVAEAMDDFELATSSEYLECVRSVLPDAMESAAAEADDDFEITETTVGPLRIEDSGERSAAFRVSMTIESEPLSVDAYFDILISQVGRATMQLSTVSVFSTPDVAFAQSLLDVMVGRIDTAAVS